MGTQAMAWQDERYQAMAWHFEQLRQRGVALTLESRAHPSVRTWQNHGRMVGTIEEAFAYLEHYRLKGRDVRVRDNGGVWIVKPGVERRSLDDLYDTRLEAPK